MDRSTVTRAIHEVRPLLAARGFAVPGQPGVRLRMLADVVAYAEACGVELRIDATERIAWAGERSSGWCLRPLQAHIQRTRRRQEPTDADQN